MNEFSTPCPSSPHSMAKLVFLLTSWSPNLSQGFNLSLLLSVKFTQLSRHFTNLLHFFLKEFRNSRQRRNHSIFGPKKPRKTRKTPKTTHNFLGGCPRSLAPGRKQIFSPEQKWEKKVFRVRNEGEGGEGCQLSQNQLEEDG